MDVSAAIIDQRVTALMEKIREPAREQLNIYEDGKLKSLGFVFMCVQTLLLVDDDEAFDCLTEGGNDFGADALYASEEQDGEFVVTLFQGKYKQTLYGDSAFPENGVKAAINAVRYLFDPAAEITVNKRLLAKVEGVRSRIRDGFIPQIRVILCNNGSSWSREAQDQIDLLGSGNQVTWEHVNHDRLLSIMQASKPVNDSLKFMGKALVEDFDYNRVLVGKVAVSEIAALVERHGDRLLERNIRRYLGLTGNRVNEGIRNTLIRDDDRSNFYFYNNGITLTCSKFEYNALQQSDYQVRIENLQIINGGQTSNTIFRAIRAMSDEERQGIEKATVLVRLYQLSETQADFVQNITYATNSQNPVDLRDLKSNDATQLRLETDIAQLGYSYRRKRNEASTKPEDITIGTAAEAVLSVWLRRPHQAKFFSREHFGKLYNFIFCGELTGAEVIVSTLIYRIAENKRKRPAADAPDFVPYASCFLAMRMGQYLRVLVGIRDGVAFDHKIFPKARSIIEEQGETLFDNAVSDVKKALTGLYNREEHSLQRLAGTFRRGDLIEELARVPIAYV